MDASTRSTTVEPTWGDRLAHLGVRHPVSSGVATAVAVGPLLWGALLPVSDGPTEAATFAVVLVVTGVLSTVAVLWSPAWHREIRAEGRRDLATFAARRAEARLVWRGSAAEVPAARRAELLRTTRAVEDRMTRELPWRAALLVALFCGLVATQLLFGVHTSSAAGGPLGLIATLFLVRRAQRTRRRHLEELASPTPG